MIFMFDMNVIKHVMNIINTCPSHAILMILIPPVYTVVVGICRSAIYRSRMSKRKATYLWYIDQTRVKRKAPLVC